MKSLVLGILVLFFVCGCDPSFKIATIDKGNNGGNESTFKPGDFNKDANEPLKWDSMDKPLSSGIPSDFIDNAEAWGDKVYFDYNKYEIKKEQRPVLDKLAEHLEKNPKLALVIEGHCDERGSTEYNRALGERRSLAVKTYLSDSGIAADRMFTISYGSDKPEIADAKDDAAHAKNRRCQFLLGTKK